jgi:oleandomycin transport system ATP-binding protein
MTTPAIEIDGLTKRYGPVTALAGLDLTVPAGAVLGLLGPNGAGKTTAVRILSTLLRPDAGTARVGGHDVQREPDAVRALIGLTGQYAAVDEDLTGRENLVLIARLLEMSRVDARRRAAGLLDQFDLAEAGGRLVKTYSGGMRRRLDLAASLLGRPRVLFLDEPTTGLDPRARGDVWDLVRGLVADGTTVLLTSQYLEEADRLATEVAVLEHGRVIAAGTPAALKARVGGQRLDVRPAGPGDLERVAAILAGVLGGEPSIDGGVVTAPGAAGPRELAEVSRRLADADVAVDEVGVRLAGLDEVFFALTGHKS